MEYTKSHYKYPRRQKVVKKKEMDFDTWLEYGIDHKWCLYTTCETHDGVPLTVDEEFEFNEGHDPCVHVLRLFDSDEAWEEGNTYMESNIRHRVPHAILYPNK